jgi:hypothetical protein
VKLAARHAGDSGGQCNERADHRQQTRNEHRRLPPTLKETVGPIEFAAAHQDPAPVALHQRAPAVVADLVGDQRAQIASDGARRRDPHQFHRTLKHQVPREGHDQFRRQRNAGGLDRHQDRDARVAGRGHDRLDEDEQYGEDFLSHELGFRFWALGVGKP